MLKTTLLHPEILRACARAGHHAKILIADGNYPASTKRGSQAEVVCLQLMPGVPTVAASGLPGYESGTATGMFAPARTPATVIRKLNEEIVRLLNMPEMKERLLSSGLEVIGSSPSEFTIADTGDSDCALIRRANEK